MTIKHTVALKNFLDSPLPLDDVIGFRLVEKQAAHEPLHESSNNRSRDNDGYR